jgi:hypothetical protein
MAKRTAHPIRPTQPYLNHETLTQDQQAKFLGVKEETTMNLGHPVPVSRLTDNPVGYPRDYENGPAARVINETRSQGVYQKFADPKDGRSTQQNLDRWSDYAKSNSFHGENPRGRGQGSDGHLASTKNWGSFDYGSESGPGRLEKAGKR